MVGLHFSSEPPAPSPERAILAQGRESPVGETGKFAFITSYIETTL